MREGAAEGQVRREKSQSSLRSQEYTDGHSCLRPGCGPRSAELKGVIGLAAAKFL